MTMTIYDYDIVLVLRRQRAGRGGFVKKLREFCFAERCPATPNTFGIYAAVVSVLLV